MIALLGAAFSCSKTPDDAGMLGEDVLSLELFCTDPATKAAGTPVAGTGNENLVNQIKYFFFADENSTPHYTGTYTPQSKTAGSHRIEFKAGEGGVSSLKALFPNKKAIFYAVANYTGDLSGKTLKEIKETPIEKTYGTEAEMTGTSGSKYFIMVAEQEIEAKEKVVSMPLKRIAAKISLTVNLSTVTTTNGDETTTWTPVWEVARGALEREATKGMLGAGASYETEATGEEGESTTETNYYIPADLGLTNSDYINYSATANTQSFYSLPNHWEAGDPNEPDLKFIVRWEMETKKNGTTVYKGISDERYYKIMLPGELYSLDANCWYQLTATVGVNASEMEPLVALDGFTVLKWSTPDDIVAANINNVKFISPEKSNASFYGQSTSISYAASGPVEMSIKKIYQVRFTNSGESEFLLINNGSAQPANIAALKDSDGNTLTEAKVRAWVPTIVDHSDGGTVTINHTLCNDFTKTYFDATPYVYVLTLHLTNEGMAYDKDITIRQIPNFTLEQIESNKSVFINNTAQPNNSYSSVNASNEFLFNNYYYYNNWGRRQEGQITGRGIGVISSVSYAETDTDNNSKYLYLVSAAISEDYSVIDPRIAGTDNLVNNALNGLSNYKSARDIDAVAPLFIIASSYGKTSSLTYNAAKVRCAAYQENGYPAGRWRLPTEKEIEFLITLRKRGLIAELFHNSTEYTGSDEQDAGYWASSGRFYFYDKEDFSEFKYSDETYYHLTGAGPGGYEYEDLYTSFTRCVYDAWYWGAEPLDNSGKKVTEKAGNNPATKWLKYDYANKISND